MSDVRHFDSCMDRSRLFRGQFDFYHSILWWRNDAVWSRATDRCWMTRSRLTADENGIEIIYSGVKDKSVHSLHSSSPFAIIANKSNIAVTGFAHVCLENSINK